MLTAVLDPDCTYESLQIKFLIPRIILDHPSNWSWFSRIFFFFGIFFKKFSKKLNVKPDLKSTALNSPWDVKPRYTYLVALSYLNIVCLWNLLVYPFMSLLSQKSFQLFHDAGEKLIWITSLALTSCNHRKFCLSGIY